MVQRHQHEGRHRPGDHQVDAHVVQHLQNPRRWVGFINDEVTQTSKHNEEEKRAKRVYTDGYLTTIVDSTHVTLMPIKKHTAVSTY